MRPVLLLPLCALFVGAAACGSVVALEGGDAGVDAGSSVDASSTTPDASTEPAFDETTCPTTAISLPATFTGASYTGAGRSVALGGGLLQPFAFSQAGVTPVGEAVDAAGFAEIYALAGSRAFAVSEGFSDDATRKVRVFGAGFVEGPTVAVANGRFLDLRREGLSSDNQFAYVSSSQGIPVVAIHNANSACFGCDFVGVAGDSLYVVRDGALERRTLTTDSPGTSVVARTALEDGPEPPRLVGVGGRLLFLNVGERNLVLDRETLTEAPFAWESDELVRAVVEGRDGTLNLFSIQYGEIAFASHRDASGKMLARGEGLAAYGFAGGTPCGFWVGNRHIPFAK